MNGVRDRDRLAGIVTVVQSSFDLPTSALKISQPRWSVIT